MKPRDKISNLMTNIIHFALESGYTHENIATIFACGIATAANLAKDPEIYEKSKEVLDLMKKERSNAV